jgi:heterodisulfide reductase subunit A-like polyferredoxin
MDKLPPSTASAPDQKPEVNSDANREVSHEVSCDVTVIGGGLAGKAASLQLAKAGLKVICIEPDEPAPGSR